MTSTDLPAETPVDRRHAQKQRTRAQIVEAAGELVREHPGERLNVEQLIERADVSRRTIFNHFETLDEILIAVGFERLRVFRDALSDRLAHEPRPLDRTQLLALFGDVLQHESLPDTIAYFVSMLGVAPQHSSRSHQIFHGVFNQLSEVLIADMLHDNPALDRFDADLVIANVIGGMEVVTRAWLPPDASQPTACVNGDTVPLTPESRDRFRVLLARLIASWQGSAPTEPSTHA